MINHNQIITLFDYTQDECGARFGATWGMEFPQYFVPKAEAATFVEVPTERRSNADYYAAEEVAATRGAAGLWETAIYARYEVMGPGAAAWLDRLFASKLPAVGRVRLATMLKPDGKMQGDLTLARLAEDRFLIVGSYYLQEWHQRWFHSQLPSDGSVRICNVSDELMGFSLSGPRARDILAVLCPGQDVSNKALPFMAITTMDVGPVSNALVARISLTGEMGYEVTVPVTQHRALWRALMAAGEPLGMRQIGNRALESLRHEKAYGIWSLEFTQAYSPAACGLDRFIDFDKPYFVGREAVLRERTGAGAGAGDTSAGGQGPPQRLVQLSIDAPDADARMLDPVWHRGKLVGSVTSGAYGHHVKQSLALAYIDAEIAGAADAALTVHVVGEPRPARILLEPPYDPKVSELCRACAYSSACLPILPCYMLLYTRPYTYHRMTGMQVFSSANRPMSI